MELGEITVFYAVTERKKSEVKKVKKEIRSLDFSLRTSLNVIFYIYIVHQINIATKIKFKVVSKRHLKKLDKFRKRKGLMRNETKSSMYIKHTVHSFSSYALSSEEYKAFSYGLDHHIPTSRNYNADETEFELLSKIFYQIFCTFLKMNWRSWKVDFEKYAISTTR